MDLQSRENIDLKNDPNFMSVSEVAKVLHLAASTVYYLVQRMEIPSHRVGRSIRIRRSELETYLNEHYQNRRIQK